MENYFAMYRKPDSGELKKSQSRRELENNVNFEEAQTLKKSLNVEIKEDDITYAEDESERKISFIVIFYYFN
jgi:hypothetical protein